MKPLDRKDKINILKRLSAGQPVDGFLAKKDFVYIKRADGIHEVGTGKIIDPESYDDHIKKLRKENPFLNVNPILICITREKI